MPVSKLILIAFSALSFCSYSAFAARGSSGASYGLGGGDSLGIGVALVSSSQGDINAWIDSTLVPGTKNVGSGLELTLDYEFHFCLGKAACSFPRSLELFFPAGK